METVLTVEAIVASLFVSNPGTDQPVSEFLIANRGRLLTAGKQGEPARYRNPPSGMLELGHVSSNIQTNELLPFELPRRRFTQE